MDGIWGGGREGHAALAYLNQRYGRPALIVADENPTLDWPDLTANARLFRGPDALPRLFDTDRVVVSPGVPGVHPFRQALSERGILLTSGTDLWMADHAPQAIGVTGTKGKSTTASLITALLQRGGAAARLAGNIGLPLLSLPDFPGTTVTELSSYQCHSLTRSPRVAVIVNLYQEHLTWHGSLESYWADKCRIFTQGAHSLIADVETLDTIAGLGLSTAGLRVVTPADEVHALIDAAMAAVGPDRLSLLFSSGPGVHNLALAVCAVQAWGVDVSQAALSDVIGGFEPLPHRLSLVSRARGRQWYDDSLSTSAESLVAAAKALEDGPRVLIVGGQSRGISYAIVNDYLMTQSGNLPYIITLPSNGPEIVARFEQSFPGQVAHAASLAEAVGLAAGLGPQGTSVILSPGAPSYDLYANYEAKSADFVDRIKDLG